MPIQEKSADGLVALIAQVLEISAGLPPESILWFRGLSKNTHPLLPKLLRDGKPYDDTFEREARLLTRFRQRSLPYWPAGYPQDDWEHLFAMQHHGMPTRLLDWSESLFVAAHFALASVKAGIVPVVWCVEPVAWNRSTPLLSEFGNSIHILTTSDEEVDPYRPNTTKRRMKSPVAIFGTHNSARIVAQRGTFMIWGSDFRPLEEIALEPAAANLWKINLNGDPAKMANELRVVGFRETMVFPELTALARELSSTEGWR